MRLTAWLLVGLVGAVFLAACGSDSDQESEVPKQAAVDLASPPDLAAGAWRIRATAEPARIGPIAFAIENLRRDERNSRAWIEHDFVFRNTGDQPVTFADTRSSSFIGGRDGHRLLAADAGCGYSRNNPGSDVEAGACFLYLDLLTVEPHASAQRPITLYRELPGMERLSAGTYVFPRPVHFQLGDQIPDRNEGRSEIVRLVYQVLPRSE